MKNKFSKKLYEKAVQGLLLRFPSFQNNGKEVYNPGLDHIERICGIMGNPQNSYPCIHVAGTNGKGSTCNFICASLVAEGMKVGLYTSPHIVDFRERMRVVTEDGATLIRPEQVWNILQEYSSDFDRLNLSFFEITTSMAFLYFELEKVDIAVVETGLGGRLDATNIITPLVSVITNIGYDHMDILGGTLPLIAGEKAGIIKDGIPVVIGESSPETDGVFIKEAEHKGAPIFFADREDVPSELFRSLDLKGAYQARNLVTACCALRTAGRVPHFDNMSRAAAICDFHGRWEKLGDTPYTICDIGHNEHGLKYNFRQLNDLLDSGEFSDLVMVYGSVRDKDVDAVLRILPKRAYIFFTAADSARALPAEELFRRAGHPEGEVTASVSDAVAKALERCNGLSKPLLYIGGSTYVIGEAVKELKNRN